MTAMRFWAGRVVPPALVAAGIVAALALRGAGGLERADFVFNNAGEVASLDPSGVTGIPEDRVVRALFEGLVGRHPDTLKPQPASAASWTVSPDGLTWRFTLRPGARWSNGDPLTASDLAWSFRRFLSPETAAGYAYLLWNVVGARELSTGRDAQGRPVEPDSVPLGIAALESGELEFRLHEPDLSFLDRLAYPALYPVHRASLERAQREFPNTWRSEWLKPERIVGNGPFVLVERRINDRIRMARNELYWDAENVAMRTVDALAIEHWGTALNLYLAGDIDWLDGTLPTALVPTLMEREDFTPAPYLGIYFYRINVTKPPLDDPEVRRALWRSIPRKEICEKILGAGQAPSLTFVPWGRLGGYSSPRGMGESITVAKRHLSEAGYGEGGKPLPRIEIHYNTSETHRDVAEVIAASWRKHLGLDVRLANQERKVHLDTQRSLGYDVSRSSWIADYPDPLTFLEIFVSGGENNRTGWGDPQYDQLIERARTEQDTRRRNELLNQAERILLRDAPVLPIYSYVSQNLVDPRLGGFAVNDLNEQSPKDWFWMDEKDLAEARRRQSRNKTQVPSHGPVEGLYAPAVRAPAGPAGETGRR